MADGEVGGGGTPTRRSAPARAVPWELAELGAVVVIVVIGVLAASALASSIVGSTIGGVGSEAASTVLLQATVWADFAAGLLLVVGAALVWHEAREWEGPEDVDSAAHDPAWVHRRRIKGLASWTAAAVFIVAIASVGPFTSVLLETDLPSGSALAWQQYLVYGGEAVATLVLCAFALFLAVRARVEFISFRDEAGEVEGA